MLQAVAGANQIIAGPAFEPLTVRVTDSAVPPHPILGASVVFQSTVLRPAGSDSLPTPGDPSVPQTGMPVILSVSESTVPSDANGLASVVPSVGSFTGTLEIEIQVSAAGTSAALQDVMESFPESSGSVFARGSPGSGAVHSPLQPPQRIVGDDQ